MKLVKKSGYGLGFLDIDHRVWAGKNFDFDTWFWLIFGCVFLSYPAGRNPDTNPEILLGLLFSQTL
jgi:hypothetical protein